MPLAGEADVCGKAALARQQRAVFEARHRAADEFLCGCRTHGGLPLPWGEGVRAYRSSLAPSPGALRAPTSPPRGEVKRVCRMTVPHRVHLRISFAAARTALLMFWSPVQRHRLDDST